MGSVSGKGVPCPLPRPTPPAPRHFELVLLLNQTDSDKQTGGRLGVEEAFIDRTFRLPRRPGVDKSKAEGFCEACV